MKKNFYLKPKWVICLGLFLLNNNSCGPNIIKAKRPVKTSATPPYNTIDETITDKENEEPLCDYTVKRRFLSRNNGPKKKPKKNRNNPNHNPVQNNNNNNENNDDNNDENDNIDDDGEYVIQNPFLKEFLEKNPKFNSALQKTDIKILDTVEDLEEQFELFLLHKYKFTVYDYLSKENFEEEVKCHRISFCS